MNSNHTPLHDAVWNEHFECVKLLFQNSADYILMNDEGETPSDLGNDEVKKIIKDLDEIPELKDACMEDY